MPSFNDSNTAITSTPVQDFQLSGIWFYYENSAEISYYAARIEVTDSDFRITPYNFTDTVILVLGKCS